MDKMLNHDKSMHNNESTKPTPIAAEKNWGCSIVCWAYSSAMMKYFDKNSVNQSKCHNSFDFSTKGSPVTFPLGGSS